MGEYFVRDYSGAPFELFGPAHLAALGVVIAILIFVGFFWKNPSPKSRRIFRVTLAIILLVNETAWHLWNLATGQWTIQTMLPLHICSILVYASAIMLLTGNYRIYEFAYFLGIGAATQALLTPDAGVYGFPHFRFFQVIISHGAIVIAAVYMTAIEHYRPTWSSLGRVAFYGNLYMAFVGLVNWGLGSNYLFIAHKPETASLMDVLPPWPWYIPVLELIALTVCLLLYLPFALADRKRLLQAKREIARL